MGDNGIHLSRQDWMHSAVSRRSRWHGAMQRSCIISVPVPTWNSVTEPIWVMIGMAKFRAAAASPDRRAAKYSGVKGRRARKKLEWRVVNQLLMSFVPEPVDDANATPQQVIH